MKLDVPFFRHLVVHEMKRWTRLRVRKQLQQALSEIRHIVEILNHDGQRRNVVGSTASLFQHTLRYQLNHIGLFFHPLDHLAVGRIDPVNAGGLK